jgi:hypothetical protein
VAALALSFARVEQADAGTRIHVKGSARIVAHAARASGKLVVSGSLTDDEGKAIEGAALSVGLTRTLDGASVAFAAAGPEACGDGSGSAALDGPERLLVTPGAAGRFCVRLPLPKGAYVAHLESRSSATVDGARLDLPVDLGLRPLTLRFEPEPQILSLDDDTTSVDVVGSIEEDGVTIGASGLRVSLADESGAAVAESIADTSGRVRFVVPSTRLGPAGRGELRASFAGAGDTVPASCSVPVERRARVALSAPDTYAGRADPGSPDEGISMRIVAATRCTGVRCTSTPTGTVEARVGDAIAGAAVLDHGEARIVMAFSSPGALEVPVRLRYFADAPWFVPEGDLVVVQPLRPPGAWKRVLVAVAGVGIMAWLAIVRRPRGRRDFRSAASGKPSLPNEGARIELVQAGTSGGWRGRVVDAHDAVAIAGARVWIERRGFDRVEVVKRVASDDEGKFVIGPVDVAPGDVLAVEARLHQVLRGPVPAQGELRIALMLRRRALVDRLVAWARGQGRPFDARPDPTPGHVRRAAGEKFALARWADAVERAAYGGAVVDEQAQAEIDRLSPADAEGSAERRPRPRAR